MLSISTMCIRHVSQFNKACKFYSFLFSYLYSNPRQKAQQEEEEAEAEQVRLPADRRLSAHQVGAAAAGPQSSGYTQRQGRRTQPHEPHPRGHRRPAQHHRRRRWQRSLPEQGRPGQSAADQVQEKTPAGLRRPDRRGGNAL
ncbi:unnamed protein product [Trichogramma brassicae]|uniref:Uncharacterized protein n=1 Tax=Trichogramma brassicae TaxID=86971 RepID=A0A6H5J143_9HYME|nr:unnamed protein product [Trichogramma brassicae]